MVIAESNVSHMPIGQGQKKIGDLLRVSVFIGGNLISWKSKEQQVVL